MTLKLITRPELVQEDVVERLELILDRARKGEITGVAIAYETCTQGIGTSYSQSDDFGRLLGAITLLQYRACISE